MSRSLWNLQVSDPIINKRWFDTLRCRFSSTQTPSSSSCCYVGVHSFFVSHRFYVQLHHLHSLGDLNRSQNLLTALYPCLPSQTRTLIHTNALYFYDKNVQRSPKHFCQPYYNFFFSHTNFVPPNMFLHPSYLVSPNILLKHFKLASISQLQTQRLRSIRVLWWYYYCIQPLFVIKLTLLASIDILFSSNNFSSSPTIIFISSINLHLTKKKSWNLD